MRTFTFTLLLALLSTGAFATQNKNLLKLRLQAVTSGYLDETTIFFDESIDPSYNSDEDAAKIFNSVPGVPSIYSFTTNNVKVGTNGFGTLATTEVIKLGFKVSTSGDYKITASDISNFDGTSIIRLEDRKMGVFIDLRSNFYTVQLYKDDATTGRFFIHVSTPSKFTATSAGCDNNDGKITIQSDSSISWDAVQLTDINNAPIATYVNSHSSDINFNGLAEGNYNVSFLLGSYYTTRVFYMSGNHVVASIAAPSDLIIKGQDVIFNGNATHANHYTWDFGEGTVITGIANPTVSYLQAGNFNVTLTCSNDFGCTTSVQQAVSVGLPSGIDDQNTKTIKVFAQDKNIIVSLNDMPNSNAEIAIYNLLGASVNSHPFNSQKEVINLDNQPNGYYIVSVKNGGKVNTSRVFLSK